MKRIPVAALLLVACQEAASPAAPPSVETLTKEAAALEQDLIEFRRDIHRNPELPGEEARTAARVAERLRAIGLEVRTDIGGHGVVGVLRGGKPGPVVAYRSELDAMPGNEPPGRPYGSQVPGVYHVCGHDVHMAVAVGVASVLASVRAELPGTVVFVFQPAEETLQGAAAMLESGALDDPAPEVVYAVHSFPFPVGTMARDIAFAGLDRFRVDVLDEGASEESVERVAEQLGALGNVSVPRSAAQVSQYLDDLQRGVAPYDRAVYVDIESDSDANGSFLEGVVKAYSDAEYPALRERVRRLLDAELGPDGYRLSYDSEPFPSMVSDREVTAEAARAAAEVIGAENILTLNAQHAFSGEDFALYLGRIPGAMLLLGVGNAERGILGAPHFPDFDADEGAIQVATRAMSVALWRRLSR